MYIRRVDVAPKIKCLLKMCEDLEGAYEEETAAIDALPTLEGNAIDSEDKYGTKKLGAENHPRPPPI